MTVAEAQERVSAREFVEWQVYAKLEPFGEERQDLRSAMNCWAAICAMNGSKAGHPSDYVLKNLWDVEAATPEAVAGVMQQVTNTLKSRKKRK